jgi:hypothetical protein
MGCCESADAAERKPKGQTYMVTATADADAEELSTLPTSPPGGRTTAATRQAAAGLRRPTGAERAGDWSDTEGDGFDSIEGRATTAGGTLGVGQSAVREVPRNASSSTRNPAMKQSLITEGRGQRQGWRLLDA